MARRDSGRSNTHKEAARTSPAPSTSKDLAPAHRQHRTDRTSRVKAAFPVTVSYVSIQGGDDAHFELDTLGSDLIHKKALIRTPTLLDSPGRGGLRFDRSKTSFLSPKPVTRPRLTRLDTDLGISVGSHGGGSIHQNGSAAHPSHFPHPQVAPAEGVGAHPSLPKPAMPSQSYLEGLRGVSANSEHNTRSPHPHLNITPRSSDNSVLDLPPEFTAHHRLRK